MTTGEENKDSCHYHTAQISYNTKRCAAGQKPHKNETLPESGIPVPDSGRDFSSVFQSSFNCHAFLFRFSFSCFFRLFFSVFSGFSVIFLFFQLFFLPVDRARLLHSRRRHRNLRRLHRYSYMTEGILPGLFCLSPEIRMTGHHGLPER